MNHGSSFCCCCIYRGHHHPLPLFSSSSSLTCFRSGRLIFFVAVLLFRCGQQVNVQSFAIASPVAKRSSDASQTCAGHFRSSVVVSVADNRLDDCSSSATQTRRATNQLYVRTSLGKMIHLHLIIALHHYSFLTIVFEDDLISLSSASSSCDSADQLSPASPVRSLFASFAIHSFFNLSIFSFRSLFSISLAFD